MKTVRTALTALALGAVLAPSVATARPTCGPGTEDGPCPQPKVHKYGVANGGGGAPLQVYGTTNTKYSPVRQIKTGSKVAIVCQTRGESVYGPYGRSTLWDKLKNGGYVNDAFVNTGSDGRVAPDCSKKPNG